MNLYLISQTVLCGYDTYDSAVVAAECAEDAANTHPCGGSLIERTWCYDWAELEYIRVQLIGVAAEGTKPGVICASFNAG
jgi:hypothetical protein